MLKYMDGVRLNDISALDSLGVNKQTLVETITRSYAHQIFVDGFFNADPHPGTTANLACHCESGRLMIIWWNELS